MKLDIFLIAVIIITTILLIDPIMNSYFSECDPSSLEVLQEKYRASHDEFKILRDEFNATKNLYMIEEFNGWIMRHNVLADEINSNACVGYEFIEKYEKFDEIDDDMYDINFGIEP